MGKRQKIYIIASVSIIVLWIVFSLYLINLNKQGSTRAPLPVPTDFNKPYSNFNLLKPGVSTYKDVIKINGSPLSEKKEGNNTYLYYPTPSTVYKNVVYLKDGVVFYVIEGVFGEYKDSLDVYVKKHGEPLVLYPKYDVEGFNWYVFLKSGVGVESSNNYITQIIYFVPQSKDDFLAFIANELVLSLTPPTNKGEPAIIPAP